VHSRIFWDPR